MSSPISSKRAARGRALAACALLAACSSQPTRTGPPPASRCGRRPASAGRRRSARRRRAAAATGAAATGAPGSVRAVRPEVPPAARADFERAVTLHARRERHRGGTRVQADRAAVPAVRGAAGGPRRCCSASRASSSRRRRRCKSAVAHESGSAVAWTELGVTQRMRGEFKDAAASYEQAIAADARYAPAWRNLGVLADLYLGDPSRALAAFEQYKALTGEDKPVSGWIAELRQRLGMPAPKRPEAPAGRRGGRAAGGGRAGRTAAAAPAAVARGRPGERGRGGCRGRSQEVDHAQAAYNFRVGRCRRRCARLACSAAAVRSRSRVRRRRRRTRHRGPSSSSRAWTRARARRPAGVHLREQRRCRRPPPRARARRRLRRRRRSPRRAPRRPHRPPKRRGGRRLPARRARTVWNWIRRTSPATASCRR